MSILSQDFRSRSAAQLKNAQDLFGAAEFKTDPKVQATFVVAKVTANMLTIFADMVEFTDGANSQDEVRARRNAQTDKNHALQVAAAAGNWESVANIVDGIVKDAVTKATGGSGTGGN